MAWPCTATLRSLITAQQVQRVMHVQRCICMRGWSADWSVCLRTRCAVLLTVPLKWLLCSDVHQAAAAATASAQGGAGPSQFNSKVRPALHSSSIHPEIPLEHCPAAAAGRPCT